MKKGIFQIVLLLSLACLCAGGFIAGRYVLHLPFRATNDALHKDEAPITLDFLIPGGAYVDDKALIGDVIHMKLKQTDSPFERFIRTVSDRIPIGYRYLGNLVLFFFWTLCFLAFMRIFTFVGYGRALRISLLFGGIVYYFMPDLSTGPGDDAVFVLFPILIIVIRFFLVRRKSVREKIFRKK